MENKEKTILQKIADIFKNDEQQTEVTNEQTEQPTVKVEVQQENMTAVIEVGAVVALPNGMYTAEDGTAFTITDGVISEVMPVEVEDEVQPTEEQTAPVEEVQQTVETPVNQFEVQFSEFGNRIQNLENIITQLKDVVNVIAKQPADDIKIERTESFSTDENKSFDKMKKYFKNEKEYKAWVALQK